jgi:phage FluMu gp28-like protein
MQLTPELRRRIRRWVHDPVSFAHDTMRWDNATTRDAPLRLEYYQQQFLRSKRKFRTVNKSRQVGYSFLMAVEALTRAILDPGHTSLFISYRQDDATEKVDTIHKLLDASPALKALADFEPLKTEVRVYPKWSRRRSLIRSMPCRAARGKTKADVYFDEIAHYADAEEVYKGSVPTTVRATNNLGQITLASTPNGRLGVFWECVEGARGRSHWKQNVPWWHSQYLCKDIKTAVKVAPSLTTDERVRAFGRPALTELFDGMSLLDFQQEFECLFIDDGVLYYPPDLVNANVVQDTMLVGAFEDVLEMRQPGSQLVAGVDIGRHHDTTEVVITERFECAESRTGWMYAPVMVMTMDRVPTPVQETELAQLLEFPELDHLWIDANGIGWPIYEKLRLQFDGRVTGLAMSAGQKEYMAILTRRALEYGLVELPDSECAGPPNLMRQGRDFVDQFRTIRRSPGARHSKYEAVSTTHHGDKFWAFAISMNCAAEDLRPSRTYADMPGAQLPEEEYQDAA